MGICFHIPVDQPEITISEVSISYSQPISKQQYDTSKIILIQSQYRRFKVRQLCGSVSPKTTNPTEKESPNPNPQLIDFEPITNIALILENQMNNQQEKLPPVSLKNGGIYTGSWKNGKAYGYGKYQIHDCSVEGTWKNGYIIKNAIYKSKYETYTGEWGNNQFNGFGQIENVDGRIYIGQWLNGYQHGKGKEVYSDNSIYEGYFVNSLKEGYGKFILNDGSQYEGMFMNDHFHGYGTFVLFMLQQSWADKSKVYIGNWKAGLKHGNGQIKWMNGNYFKGNFECGMKHGYGEMIYNNGRIYSGNWINGKQSGEGRFTDTKGRQRKGLWNNGKLVRWLN